MSPFCLSRGGAIQDKVSELEVIEVTLRPTGAKAGAVCVHVYNNKDNDKLLD